MSKGFTLRISADEAKLIGAALAELPYRISASLIHNLQGQINLQLAEPETETAQPEPPKE